MKVARQSQPKPPLLRSGQGWIHTSHRSEKARGSKEIKVRYVFSGYANAPVVKAVPGVFKWKFKHACQTLQQRASDKKSD